MATAIIGKGGFAREVSAYMGSNPEMFESKDFGLLTNYHKVIIAIADPWDRYKVSNELKLIYISEFLSGHSKRFDHLIYGEGLIICPGCIFTTNIKIGRHCQFNLNTTIGHDCLIGDFVTTAPGVHISGNVTIGNRVYIGSGAVLKEKVTICNDVKIGAGAVVLKDIIEPGTYVGVPAIKVR